VWTGFLECGGKISLGESQHVHTTTETERNVVLTLNSPIDEKYLGIIPHSLESTIPSGFQSPPKQEQTKANSPHAHKTRLNHL
jgi:hypothetical protein